MKSEETREKNAPHRTDRAQLKKKSIALEQKKRNRNSIMIKILSCFGDMRGSCCLPKSFKCEIVLVSDHSGDKLSCYFKGEQTSVYLFRLNESGFRTSLF